MMKRIAVTLSALSMSALCSAAPLAPNNADVLSVQNNGQTLNIKFRGATAEGPELILSSPLPEALKFCEKAALMALADPQHLYFGIGEFSRAPFVNPNVTIGVKTSCWIRQKEVTSEVTPPA
jgi:hypothetical protein